MESSTQYRQAVLIEEVSYKARMINGGDHLKKWQKKMQSLREMDDRSATGFIQEVAKRKEAENLKCEVNRSMNKDRMMRHQEVLYQEQYISTEKLHREDQEVKASESLLKSLELRLALKHQNQVFNLGERLSPLKTRNYDIKQKMMTIQDSSKDREL